MWKKKSSKFKYTRYVQGVTANFYFNLDWRICSTLWLNSWFVLVASDVRFVSNIPSWHSKTEWKGWLWNFSFLSDSEFSFPNYIFPNVSQFESHFSEWFSPEHNIPNFFPEIFFLWYFIYPIYFILKTFSFFPRNFISSLCCIFYCFTNANGGISFSHHLFLQDLNILCIRMTFR